MLRTLVFIPHEVAGLPVFGLGWAMILLAIALVGRLAFAVRRQQPVAQVLVGEGYLWGMVAFAIAVIMPFVELRNVADEPVGVAIRGYGVMLLAGVVSGVALACHRARLRGLNPDVILSIAPWAFFGGILGARLFYVIQYRDRFIADSLLETVQNVFRFTEGGLVVYGSFIGGFLAVAFYVFRNRLSLLTLGDVIVPCLFLGVFFGRIGCMMNGCCYGGRCEESWLAFQFPAGSAVYHDQLRTGELLGLNVDELTGVVSDVREGSLAAQAGIGPGSRLEQISHDLSVFETAPSDLPKENVRTGVIARIDGKLIRWLPDELPDVALPVRAAQLISSLSALGLCLLLCLLSWFRLREGTVMLLGFSGYAIVRFCLELVREDEAGQFGTSLTISQLVSIVILSLSLIGLAWIHFGFQRPPTAMRAPADS